MLQNQYKKESGYTWKSKVYAATNKSKSRLLKNEKLIPFLFIAPSLLGFAIFFLIPFFGGLYYSLVDSMFNGKFVGITNYIMLFKSESFIRAGKNTLYFTTLSVPLNLLFALILALLINKKIYARGIIRTMMVSPLVVPVASVVQFWQIFIHKNGVINLILSSLNKNGVDWINSDAAIYVILLIYLWKNIGYSLVLFLAGLQNIPGQYYESAEIDGAGAWRKLTGITLIYLMPTTFFVFVMSIINSFKVFRETYLMAGEYPHESIYMLQHYMNNTFIALDYQKLTAAAFVMGIVVYIIVLILYIFERRVGENLV